MIDVKPKSKIHMHWKVSPYDYSKEKEHSLEAAVSKKYGLPRERVKVIPEFMMVNSKGEQVSMNEEIIQNIQDPVFQVQLFKEWLEMNKITDCDFDLIIEAYVADLSGANLLLTKIAEAGEVIPADNAVILKSSVTPVILTQSDAAAVTFTATNDLQGSDTQIATPANCYVLAGTDGVVGFYHYTAANLNAHKAYVVYSGSNQAPRRMPFIFDQATGVENIQGDNVQSTKVIENGVLYIIKNGVKYNAQGQVIK